MGDSHAAPVEDFPAVPYPGRIPPYSFVQHEGTVHRLADGDPVRLASGDELAAWVRERTTEPYAALLAYGSNGCPSRLSEKFGDESAPTVALRALMRGAAPAWCRSRSQGGRHRAWTLVQDARGTATCRLLLVAAANLAGLDRSEGRGSGTRFQLVELSDVTVTWGPGLTWTRPVTYLGLRSRGPLMRDGRPVTVATCAREPDDADVTDPGRWDDRWTPGHRVIDQALSAVEADSSPAGPARRLGLD